jgi:hypothetical protein
MDELEQIGRLDFLGLTIRIFDGKIAPSGALLAFLNCELDKIASSDRGERPEIHKFMIDPARNDKRLTNGWIPITNGFLNLRLGVGQWNSGIATARRDYIAWAQIRGHSEIFVKRTSCWGFRDKGRQRRLTTVGVAIPKHLRLVRSQKVELYGLLRQSPFQKFFWLFCN